MAGRLLTLVQRTWRWLSSPAGESPAGSQATDGWSAQTAQIAAVALPLILDWHSWVHRRVEQVQLLDDVRTRHHISIDFTLPDLRELTNEAVTVHPLPVPMMLARKGILRGFSVRDENDAPLAVLTRDQNISIHKAILQSLAETLLARRPADQGGAAGLSRLLRRDLEEIAVGGRDDARRALLRLADGHGGAELAGKWLWSQSAFRAVASDLTQQFIVFARLPAGPSQRRIIKVSFDGDVGRYPVRYRGLGRVLARFRTPPYALLLPQASMCDSYHAEVRLPPELVFRRVRLDLRQASEIRAISKPSEISVRPHDIVVNLTGVARGDAALLRMRVGLDRHGVLASAYYMALAATAVSVAAWLLHVLAGVGYAHDVAAPVLVILPGIFAAFLVAQPEHPLVEAFSRVIRRLILVVAGASFLESASLAVIGDPFAGWTIRLWGLGWRTTLWGLCSLGLAVVTYWLWVERRRASTNEVAGTSGKGR